MLRDLKKQMKLWKLLLASYVLQNLAKDVNPIVLMINAAS